MAICRIHEHGRHRWTPQGIQSAVLGNLTPGMKYILKVAVGARANQNWNDVGYDIMPWSQIRRAATAPIAIMGPAAVTILGTPASVTMAVLGSVPDTTNIVDSDIHVHRDDDRSVCDPHICRQCC